MAEVFTAGGYATGIFGKWHLGDNYPFRPQDRGFSEVLIHGGGVTQAPDYWGNDYFDDTYFHNGKPKSFKGYCTDIWFDGAMNFIEKNKDHPFFCFIPTNAAHAPLNVAEKYSQPYVDMGESENRAKFYGMCENIDENMGRLVKHLDRLGLADDTILIYTTDNGTGDGVIILNDGLADCSKGQVEFGLNIGSGTLILNGGSFKALGFVGSNKGRIELNGGILEVGSLTLGAVTMDITPLPCFCPIPSE